MYRLSVPLICSVILTGCVGAASVGEAEVAIYEKHKGSRALDTIQGNVEYAGDLSERYLKEATKASKSQDALALGVIGAAATGAGGLVFNSGADLIKGAGLAAGTTTAVANYLKPEEATLALLNAAEQLVCIAKSGNLVIGVLSSLETSKERTNVSIAAAKLADAKKSGGDTESERDDLKAAQKNLDIRLKSDADQEVVKVGVGILESGIRQVRVNLRKSLVRKPPDYSALINQISKMNEDVNIKNNAAVEIFGNSVDFKETLKDLRNDVIECLAISI